MIRETMTREERVWAAFRLEKPDRVPVDILATAAAFGKVSGISQVEFFNNQEKARETISKVFDDMGGWDLDCGSATLPSMEHYKLVFTMAMGLKMEFPGLDLPDDYQCQATEEEVLKLEDYETIAEIGWAKFVLEDYLFRILDITPEGLTNSLIEIAPTRSKALDFWGARGVMTLYPVSPFNLHPFFRFSMGRSMVKFMEDIYYRPETVERALKRVTGEMIEEYINACRQFGQKVAFIAEERSCGYFFPLKIFERFWWPYTLEIVDALWSEGIVTWFHLDQCWDKNIPYFKQLPRGSAVLALDGTTDIFAAKEVLRNHLCLAGDLSAALLSIGKREEVEAYCRRLIKEVGGDGGFILSSGCEMPAAVRAENWRAMIQTARTYSP